MSSDRVIAAYMATAKLQYLHSGKAFGTTMMRICITVQRCGTAQLDATAAM